MREIKFRAWDKDRKEMIKVNTIYFNNSNGLYINSLLAENMQLMQYTGLKDKYGVEIYEGDIVSCTYGIWHEEPNGLSRIGDIVYDIKSCSFRIRIKNSAVLVAFYDTTSKDIVVIGNIYDNPELLGVE